MSFLSNVIWLRNTEKRMKMSHLMKKFWINDGLRLPKYLRPRWKRDDDRGLLVQVSVGTIINYRPSVGFCAHYRVKNTADLELPNRKCIATLLTLPLLWEYSVTQRRRRKKRAADCPRASARKHLQNFQQLDSRFEKSFLKRILRSGRMVLLSHCLLFVAHRSGYFVVSVIARLRGEGNVLSFYLLFHRRLFSRVEFHMSPYSVHGHIFEIRSPNFSCAGAKQSERGTLNQIKYFQIAFLPNRVC